MLNVTRLCRVPAAESVCPGRKEVVMGDDGDDRTWLLYLPQPDNCVYFGTKQPLLSVRPKRFPARAILVNKFIVRKTSCKQL